MGIESTDIVRIFAYIGLIIGVLGLIFGAGLAVASRLFHVHVDPRIELIASMLPGANCGGCGKAGCFSFAEALVHGNADIKDCAPSGANSVKRIANILGVAVQDIDKKIAVLKCNGKGVAFRYVYDGLEECKAANLVLGGPLACGYGCMGYGTCEAACPFGAIEMRGRLPVVIT